MHRHSLNGSMIVRVPSVSFFFFNDTATTEIYTLSLHDALPISRQRGRDPWPRRECLGVRCRRVVVPNHRPQDRKSTRLNSSHTVISYAVFCLKKKTNLCAAGHRHNAIDKTSPARSTLCDRLIAC